MKGDGWGNRNARRPFLRPSSSLSPLPVMRRFRRARPPASSGGLRPCLPALPGWRSRRRRDPGGLHPGVTQPSSFPAGGGVLDEALPYHHQHRLVLGPEGRATPGLETRRRRDRRLGPPSRSSRAPGEAVDIAARIRSTLERLPISSRAVDRAAPGRLDRRSVKWGEGLRRAVHLVRAGVLHEAQVLRIIGSLHGPPRGVALIGQSAGLQNRRLRVRVPPPLPTSPLPDPPRQNHQPGSSRLRLLEEPTA